MSLWRIRIAVPDSPASRSAVEQALAAHPAAYLRAAPSDDASPAASELVVELSQDDGFTSVLSALHAISPQVFVSRADAPEAASGRNGQRAEPAPRGTG
jgi:hypothetical protein